MGEELHGNLSHGTAECENPNKKTTTRKYEETCRVVCQEWPQEFRHGLVDESVPEHRDASNTSHELSSEPRAKVVRVITAFLLTSRRTEVAISA